MHQNTNRYLAEEKIGKLLLKFSMTLKELNAKVSKEPAAEPITDAA